MIVRPAQDSDGEAILAIYAHHVLHGLGTFEETPPSAAEMAARRTAVLAQGLPYLVAEEAGAVLGFAYAGRFNARAAYRYTVEDSVYIAPDAIGKGVGKALLTRLLDDCAALGMRQMMAVVGDSGNEASLALHRSLGFIRQGVGKSLGFKHGRWVDIVWLQKSLNGGDATAPDLGDGSAPA